MDTVKTCGQFGWGLLVKTTVFNKNGDKGQYERLGMVHDVVKDDDKWFHADEPRR